MKKTVLIVVSIVILFAVGLLITFTKAFKSISEPYALRKKSTMKLQSLDDRTEVIRFDDNKKLLFFWKTDCEPCLEQLDSIVRYQNNINADIYLISFEPHDRIKSIMQNKYQELKIYTSKEDKLLFGRNIDFYPTVLVTDNDSIVDFGVGDISWREVVIK